MNLAGGHVHTCSRRGESLALSFSKVFTMHVMVLIDTGLSLKAAGPGIFPGNYRRDPWLLTLEKRGKLGSKQINSSLIPRLLLLFIGQLEILVTALV